MSDSKTNKFQVIWLKTKVAVCMSIISFIAILLPPFIIMRLNINENIAFNYACANLIFMPLIIFIITLIIRLIYKHKENIGKEIRETYMQMPIYYIFFTPLFSMFLVYVINKLTKL